MYTNENRQLLDQVKDDSSSLINLRARSSFRSSRPVSDCTEASALLSIVFDFDEEILDSDPYQRQLTTCYRQNLRLSRSLNPTSTSSKPFQEIQRPTSVTYERSCGSLRSTRSHRTLSLKVEQGTESSSEASPASIPLLTDQAGSGTFKSSKGRSLLAIIASTACGSSSLLPASNESVDREAELATSTGANAGKPDAADQILLGIMSCSENLKDLLALAYVNRGFYETFRKNELALVGDMLRSITPAASGTRQFNLLRSRLSRLECRKSPNSPIGVMKHGFGPRYESDSQLLTEFASYLCAGCGLTDVYHDNVSRVSNEAHNPVSLRKLYVSQRLRRIVPAEVSCYASNETSVDFARENASFIPPHQLETRRALDELEEDKKIDRRRSKKE